LSKLADFLVAEGVVDDISHEGLRVLLHQEGVSFQVIKTWKQSTDPDFETKKNRILHLYGLMDGTDDVQDDDPTWSSPWTSSGRSTSSRIPAASGRPGAVAACGLAADGGRPTPARMGCGTSWRPMTSRATGCTGTSSPASGAGAPRLLPLPAHAVPPGVRLGVVLDNFSPHLSTRTDRRVADWAAANNVELAYVPHQRVLAEPDRGAVPRAALLHPRGHRPRQPSRAGQHDSPLHRLAKPKRL
jgi:hypothetical protein